MTFDSVLMVDWAGGNDRGPTPKKDAIWTCVGRAGVAETPMYFRNRQDAEIWITAYLTQEQQSGNRVMVGFDFAFGYPTGFGKALTGSDDPFAVWDWFEARVVDTPQQNNRFDLAAEINARFDGIGPFWGNGLQRDIADLPRKGSDRTCTLFAERRVTEQATRAFPVWQLSGAGAVGSQVIMGLPLLSRLRRKFSVSVWPFEPLVAPITFAEIWPSLIGKLVAQTQPADRVKDAHQVWLMAKIISGLGHGDMQMLLDVNAAHEGSILGLGNTAILEAGTSEKLVPPPLRNDCFAMPQGAYWTPVSAALDHLKDRLDSVTGTENIGINDAAGRFLAADVVAARSHPPSPNAAVDGYGFAGPAGEGTQHMPLVAGRSAAGQPYQHAVPAGSAIRILTGANLPEGVDTVVLQEDVSASQTEVVFNGPLKRGANARKAGEDMQQGDVILRAGHKLTPADLGMLAAVGVADVMVRTRLRVGILSTGDELRDPGTQADAGQIYDANRPMLCAIARGWGYEVVDLGRAPDDRPELRKILDNAASRCDVILSSGGASAGDEDHMSALLKGTGSLALWRIAMKPGRPLALGLWNETPVFGLPGNPVAALVCALVFARPALRVLAGGIWQDAEGYLVPAGFTKSKKEGRREYLRARIENGQAVAFASEGSGRVSGLSWATGLVELDDPAKNISPGDLVRFIPFGNFAL